MSAAGSRAHAPSLWPREHGATMELGFPLVSAWLVGAPGAASFALGIAAILTFVAHEPLMVALGRRGARRKREQGAIAVRRLLVLGVLAGAAAGFGLWLAPWPVRALLVVPLLAGALTIAAAFLGKERSLLGEVLVAASLSSIALPVAAAAGSSIAASFTLVGVWLVGFVVGTVAARGVLLRNRDRGRGLRWATWFASLVGALAAALGVARLLPLPVALAPWPFVVVAVALRLRPPPPQRMTAIGLTLVGASTGTLVILVLGGRFGG